MDVELSSEVGIAGQLFKSSVNFFWLLIQKIDSDQDFNEEHKLALRDEFARFNFWGEGFRPEKGGLDEILAFSSSLRDQTMLLLKEVGKALCSKETGLFRIISSTSIDDKLEAQRQDLTSLIERLGTYASEAQDSDTESTISGDTELEISLESVLEELQTYVGCLKKLTLSLEHPAPDPVDAEIRTVLAIAFKVPKPAEPWCRRVTDKFQDIDIRLAERLGEANWHRFERVTKKLEEASDGEVSDGESENGELENKDPNIPLPQTESAISTATKSSFVYNSILGTDSLGGKSTITTANTILSNSGGEFRPKEQRDDTASQATWTSIISDMGDISKLHVPKLPTEALVKKSFRCTVCGDRLCNVKDQLSWKRHVFADLQPYICTLSDCKRGLATFTSRKTWAEHEFTVHRIDRTWKCPDCSQSFVDRVRFRNHISIHHGSYTKLEMEVIISRGERKSVQSPKDLTCPFCHITPGSTIKKYATHVGRHLEDVALAVLPRGLEEIVESDREFSSISTNPGFLENNSSASLAVRPELPDSWDRSYTSKPPSELKTDNKFSIASPDTSSVRKLLVRKVGDEGLCLSLAGVEALLLQPPSTGPIVYSDYEMEQRDIKKFFSSQKRENGESSETYLAHLRLLRNPAHLFQMPEDYLVLVWHQNGWVHLFEVHRKTAAEPFSLSVRRKWAIENISEIICDPEIISHPEQPLNFTLDIRGQLYSYVAGGRYLKNIFIFNIIVACSQYTGGNGPVLRGFSKESLHRATRALIRQEIDAIKAGSRLGWSGGRIPDFRDRSATTEKVESLDLGVESLNRYAPSSSKEPLRIPSNANPRFAFNDRWTSEDFENTDEWSAPPARSTIVSAPYLEQKATRSRRRDPPTPPDRRARPSSSASNASVQALDPGEPGSSKRPEASRSSRSSEEKKPEKSGCVVM